VHAWKNSFPYNEMAFSYTKRSHVTREKRREKAGPTDRNIPIRKEKFRMIPDLIVQKFLSGLKPFPSGKFPLDAGRGRAYLFATLSRTGRVFHPASIRRDGAIPFSPGCDTPNIVREQYSIVRLRLSLGGEASLLSSSVASFVATAEARSPCDNLAARICAANPCRQIGVGELGSPLSDYLKRKLLLRDAPHRPIGRNTLRAAFPGVAGLRPV
jgi:hypothetical protein